ncbi:bacteriophage abortive infection AbiH family protein [Clostridium sp.]|uniref:bacteriophage abortive infection AbiH family protein n=1 Tax=Clostridium sp. TaxID=1506 RepID=UPI00257D15E0|nr:bacteriophage abortive infection AbiH family protein [Clostridium sp.]MBE6058006.1 hypothetical protein [Clostridium sp.]
MKNFFIIGNGFDLAHNVKTSYEEFHKYLEDNYCYKEDLFNIPESNMLPDGGEIYDDDEVVTILINLISQAEELGENWSDIETSLGLLDYNTYLEGYKDVYIEDDDGDGDNLWKSDYLYEDVSRDMYNCTIKIKELFYDWANTIDISDCVKKNKFIDLVNVEDDIFLTFNYTTVLEEIYNAKNVYHIHGVQGGDIIIGHGKNECDSKSMYIGSESSLEKLHEDLKKKTEEIINSFEIFKMDFGDINEIYSFGFSFPEVDMPYIAEICNKINTQNTIWYLNNYESEEIRGIYKEKIRACGFKGSFKVYNL